MKPLSFLLVVAFALLLSACAPGYYERMAAHGAATGNPPPTSFHDVDKGFWLSPLR